MGSFYLFLLLLFHISSSLCLKKDLEKGFDSCIFGTCNNGSGSVGCCPPPKAKCCDSSCPKCIGGKPPLPGSGCKYGCPYGDYCPGTCPCDDCVCCYTSTFFKTTTSTSLINEKILMTATTTSTKTELVTYVFTSVVPVTFTVEEFFTFQSVTTYTTFPASPYLTTEILSTLNIQSASTIFFSTVVINELTLTRTANTIEISTNPTTTILQFISEYYVTTYENTEFDATSTLAYATTLIPGFISTLLDFVWTTSPTYVISGTTIFSYTVESVPLLVTLPVDASYITAITQATLFPFSINSYSTELLYRTFQDRAPGTGTFFKFIYPTDSYTLATSTIETIACQPLVTSKAVTTLNACAAVTKHCGGTTSIPTATTQVFVLGIEMVTTTLKTGILYTTVTVSTDIIID